MLGYYLRRILSLFARHGGGQVFPFRVPKRAPDVRYDPKQFRRPR